jgi:hypothetical protein
MTQDRLARLLDAYFNMPRKEYISVLGSIIDQGGLNADEIMSIQLQLPYVHASAIIRQLASVAA